VASIVIDGADISIPFTKLSGSFHCPQTNYYLKKLCQVPQYGSANLPPPKGHGNECVPSITNALKGVRRTNGSGSAGFPPSHVCDIQNLLRMAAAPPNTAAVVADGRNAL